MQSHKLANVCYDIRGPVLEEAKRLEDQLPDIVRSLALAGPALVKRREEQEAEDHNTKSEDEEPRASREGGAEKIPESGDGLEDSGPDEHRPRVI